MQLSLHRTASVWAIGIVCAASSAVWAQTPSKVAPSAATTGSAAASTDLTACLARLRPAAMQARISANTWVQHTQGLEADFTVVERLNFQPEFRTAIWDYLAGLVDDERVQDGQRQRQAFADTLSRAEARFGVPPSIVTAVWGVESNYGQTFGRHSLVQALGTLACHGRRQTFFQGEFFAALRILQAGHIEPERLVGSWAGAFGHTQFMPTTFERLAIDFDGDGRADLMDNPIDALGSTAHFLARSGWQRGLPWGVEVQLPRGFSTQGEGRRTKRPVSEWSARGVRLANGATLPPGLGSVGLVAPAGAQGPAFLVTRNFDALFSYNAAESYALAIAHLADRIDGAGPFSTPWPTDDPGLSRAERRELQGLLILRGHDIGPVDGMLGERSRAAIRLEQERLGHEATGRGGQKILQALRSR